MKLGLLTQWFDPEPGGGAVPGVLARGLAANGNDIRVLTGFPNYPTGHIYEGYRQRAWHVEQVSPNIAVRRVPLYPSHDGRALQRASNYLSFAASGAALGSRFLAGADAVWVYNSPATIGLVAGLLTRRDHVPYLLHVMDVWPDSVLDSGMISGRRSSKLMTLALHRLVDATYKNAAEIAVTSPGQQQLLVERGVPSARLHYVPVWADESIYYPRTPDRGLLPREALDAPLIVMYAGAIGHVQALDEAVRAAAIAKSSGVQLVFVGSGVAEEGLKHLAASLHATNVHFMGPRQPLEMGDLASAADMHLVSLASTPLLRVTMPSKVQSIMALGKPIIAYCSGDAASVVASAEAGVVVPQGRPEELASTLAALAVGPKGVLETWGRAGRKFYEAQFSRRTSVEKVERLLAAAAAS